MTIGAGLLYIHRDDISITGGQPGEFSLANFGYANFFDEADEIINHARTFANVASVPEVAKDLELFERYDVDVETLWYEDDSFWVVAGAQKAIPSGPADGTNPAPWYDASIPASAEALGFFVTQASGSDAANYRRSMTVAVGGGATTSIPFSAERVLTVRCLAIGSTARGVQYLQRWLERQLLAMNSRRGPIDSVYFRLYPPDLDNVGDYASTARWSAAGRVLAHDTVCVQAPTLSPSDSRTPPPNIRELTFTIAAGSRALTQQLDLFGVDSGSFVSQNTARHTKSLPAVQERTTFPTPDIGFSAPVFTFGCNREHDASDDRVNSQDFLVAILGPTDDDVYSAMRFSNVPSGSLIRVDYAQRLITLFDPYIDTANADLGAADTVDLPLRLTRGNRYVSEEGAVWDGEAASVEVPLVNLPRWDLGPAGATRRFFWTPYYQGRFAGSANDEANVWHTRLGWVDVIGAGGSDEAF